MSHNIQGIGVAGTPRGGVVTVQGDPDGEPIPVVDDTPPEEIIGSYSAGQSNQAYAASATVKICSFNNPSGSGRIVVLRWFIPDVVPQASSAIATIGLFRTSDTPSGGTQETNVKKDSSYPSAVGVFRTAPTTATPTGGYLYRLTMGSFAQLGAYPPNSFYRDNPLYLRPGEGIVWTGTLQNCNVGVNVQWEEIDE